MIHDYLIDNIVEKAYDEMDNNNYIKAANFFSRAWKRIYDNIMEKEIDTIEKYNKIYENDFFLENFIYDYIGILQDCFMENGDRKYLDETIVFKEKYIDLFKSNEDLYCWILKHEIEAIYYLGQKEEAIDRLKEIIKEYRNYVNGYLSLVNFLNEMGRIPESKEVLKYGIKESKQCKEELSDILENYDEYYRKV